MKAPYIKGIANHDGPESSGVRASWMGAYPSSRHDYFGNGIVVENGLIPLSMWQGIGGQIIRPRPSPNNDNAVLATIRCRSRLGGQLRFYHREAA